MKGVKIPNKNVGVFQLTKLLPTELYMERSHLKNHRQKTEILYGELKKNPTR